MPVTTRYEYDPAYMGAYLTKKTTLDVTDADGQSGDETYTYDFATGRLQTSTDGNLNTTAYEYDALGRLVTETLPTGEKRTDAYNDAANNIIATDERGFDKTYQFDGIGQLKKVFDNFTGITPVEFEYDQAGRKTKSIDGNGNYWSYQYDPLGRLTKKERCDYVEDVITSTTVEYDDAFSFTTPDNPSVKPVRYQRGDRMVPGT